MVTVRQWQFVVTEVTRSAFEPDPLRKPGHGPRYLVSLCSIEDDSLGKELEVFWELVPGAGSLETVSLREASGQDVRIAS
jgi:hypothetical protein